MLVDRHPGIFWAHILVDGRRNFPFPFLISRHLGTYGNFLGLLAGVANCWAALPRPTIPVFAQLQDRRKSLASATETPMV